MRQIVIIAAATAILASAAPAYEVKKDMLTVEGGVVCLYPFSLHEGIIAANRGDEKWIRELGCMRLRAGVRAIRLNPRAGLADPWQVRLLPGKPEAATMWGYAPSFTSMDGKKLWPY